jgi:hypothetical protein
MIPLTAMSKNPRYECIGAFSLRFLPIQVLRGAEKWAIIFLYEIKAKQPNGLPQLLEDLGDP